MIKCNLSTAKDDVGAEIATAKIENTVNNRLNNLSIIPPFLLFFQKSISSKRKLNAKKKFLIVLSSRIIYSTR